jgi:hypothetical protein
LQVQAKFSTMLVVFNLNKLQAHVDEFEAIAFHVFRRGKATGSLSVQDRRARAWFGCSLLVLAKTWVLLCRQFVQPLPERATKLKFLWAVILLKSYDAEEVNASRVGGVDQGTFCYWSWWFVDEISYLEPSVVREDFLFEIAVINNLFLLPPRFFGKTGSRMTLEMIAWLQLIAQIVQLLVAFSQTDETILGCTCTR